MRTWLLRVLTLAVLLGASRPVAAQNYGTATDGVREQLARQWNDSDPNQHERAYCVLYRERPSWQPGVRIYELLAVMSATVVASSVYTVASSCPTLQNVVLLHTHTVSTCHNVNQREHVATDCYLGGVDAYQCKPSGMDIAVLRQSGAPFNVVQCDRHALVFYFAQDQPPPPPAPNLAKPVAVFVAGLVLLSWLTRR